MAAARLRSVAATDDSGWYGDLFEIIKKRSFRKGRYQLASGAWSDLYFNMKPTMMDPHGGALVAAALLGRLHEEGAEYVGGLAIGAVPTLGAIASLGYAEGRPIPTFFVRQEPKNHGTKDLIEGLAPDESLRDKRVVVIDDVATKGGSIMQAIAAAREAGAIIDTALVIVDREEGAEARLAGDGVRLTSLFRAHQFL